VLQINSYKYWLYVVCLCLSFYYHTQTDLWVDFFIFRANRAYWENLKPASGRPFCPSLSRPGPRSQLQWTKRTLRILHYNLLLMWKNEDNLINQLYKYFPQFSKLTSPPSPPNTSPSLSCSNPRCCARERYNMVKLIFKSDDEETARVEDNRDILLNEKTNKQNKTWVFICFSTSPGTCSQAKGQYYPTESEKQNIVNKNTSPQAGR